MKRQKKISDTPEREFCRLCREGRLFEAEAWLKAGKPADCQHKNVLCTPLGIAIANNFHSLVEVLIKNGLKPSVKHFWLAVRRGRTGMVELMLQNGVDLRWLDLREAVQWLNPEIIHLFVEHGADTRTGYPIAEAFKRAPKPICGIYKTFIDRFPEWKFQADMALRHFCQENSMRGVSLLLWLKANPRAEVPLKDGDEPEIWTSGLWQACSSGHLEIVKKIGPNRTEDDLNDLLRVACNGQSVELINYLVERGADPKVRTKDGAGILKEALWSLDWRLGFESYWSKKYFRVDGNSGSAFDVLKRLVELGVKLEPMEQDEVKFLRECFQKMKGSDLLEFIRFLVNHEFADRKTMRNILKNPTILMNLDRFHPRFYKLFPELKPKD